MKTLLLLLIFLTPLHAAEQPNIVYINADDLGWTDLGVQGSTYYETPHLDKLAASGIRFTNAYAAAANCAPSRACAMTGQWTQRHGIYTVGSSARGKSKHRKLIPTTNTEILHKDFLTIPQALQQAGYFTAHIGKWHLSDDPCQYGFDLNKAGFHGGSPSKGGYHSPYQYPNIKNEDEGEYLTDRLASEAVNLIQQRKEKPFFLSFTPYTVHLPLQGRADLVEKFTNKEKAKKHNNPIYAAMVHSLDLAVGRILQTLREENLLSNTLIIFTSDNGGHRKATSNAPLRSGKGSYYEGGIREPFFFSWAGKIEAGQVDHTPITNLDLFPTLMAAAQASSSLEETTHDGTNLLPLLLSSQTLAERALFWHFPVYLQAYHANDLETRDPLFRTRPGSVIRLGPWKLHHYFEDNAYELYHLTNDPSEQSDLSQKNPEKVTELKTLLENWRKTTNAPIPSKLNPDYKEPKE